jgi:hypothetical protein
LPVVHIRILIVGSFVQPTKTDIMKKQAEFALKNEKWQIRKGSVRDI